MRKMMKSFKKGFGYSVGNMLGLALSMAVIFKVMSCLDGKKEKPEPKIVTEE
jgi:hypothetical protein